MKILVTGGAGFIGSNLVRHLIRRTPHEVVNIDKLTYAGNLGSLGDVEGDSRYFFEQTDLADASELRRAFRKHRPDAVMHLAAESHVDRSIDGPGQFVQTNVVGTFNLLQASLGWWREAGMPGDFRYLQVSTDEVYGALGLSDAPFTETTAYDPRSPYSASKAAADHLARAWHATYGLPVLVTNSSNNFGPRQFPEKLVPLVILKGLREEAIPIFGTGENVRDWLFVEDHCEALVAVMKRGRVGRTYNLGGGRELSNLEMVRAICGILDEANPRPGGEPHSELIDFVEDRPGHDLRYAIDSRRVLEEVGWSPRSEFVESLRRTIRWYLNNRDWWESILSGTYQMDRLGVAERNITC
jgi:dTDP-glucose 4,6-dehydratase